MHDDATLPGDDTANVAYVDVPARRSLERGNRLGRYTVLELLGKGGMGLVYAAYDPQLDRRVAVKVLRSPGAGPASEVARQRLLREAQAMARLSHPNVVTVHDVGTVDDEVFVAMEFVDGPTLGAWLEEHERSTAEVVEVFAQAGRGLAAAHAAGLVHRDFKPANVLIDHHGRAKVTDFGLVRADDTPADDDALGELAELRSGSRDQTSPTLTDGVGALGTPAYMAPEQHAREDVDARTDQFGFCVALYEALFGQHPFGTESLMELVSAVSRGVRRETPSVGTVPSHVRRAILRGLERDPEHRWPDMDSLLATLLDDPGRRRRRWLLGAAGVVTAGALMALAARPRPAPPAPPSPCEGSGDELLQVWNPERHDTIAAAFEATGQAHAPPLWDRSADLLDRYAESWRSSARDACEATRVRGEQSDSLFDLRRACLDRRLHELDARLTILAGVDDELLDKSFGLATGLTPIEICNDVEHLRQTVALPEDPALAERVAQLRRQASTFRVKVDAGLAPTIAEEVERFVKETSAVGYAPVHAEALWIAAIVQEEQGRFEDAEATSRRAVVVAAEGGDDQLIAKIWANMPYLVGYLQGRPGDAELLSVVAEAAIARVGRPDDLMFPFEHGMGAMRFLQGDHEDAQAHYLAAMLHLGDGDDDLLARTRVLNNLAVVRMTDGHYEEARELFEEAQLLKEGLVRPEHITIAEVEQNLSAIATYLGDFEEGLVHIDRAVAIVESSQPDGGLQHAAMLSNRSHVLRELGRLEAARRDIDAALRMAGELLAPDNPNRAAFLSNLSELELIDGNVDAARETLLEALSLIEATLGTDHSMRALLLGQRGRLELIAGDLETSRALLDEALPMLERGVGADHPQVADVLRIRGDLARAEGRDAAARADFERAIELLERRPGNRRELARARFGLARTLPASERERALRLATAARERLDADARADEVAEIDAWRASVP